MGASLVRREAVVSPLEGVLIMWSSVANELRELGWLALMVLGLSATGVGLSAALVLTLTSVH
jgi:hypothetical protein